MRVAYLFPGQGLQEVGMGSRFSVDVSKNPELEKYADLAEMLAHLYREASDGAEINLARLCLHGPKQELDKTENTQPAVLVTSIAALKVFEKIAEESALNLEVAAAAGHSSGQYSAMIAAGSLTLGSGASLVRTRGIVMRDYAPDGYGMAAIVGLEEEKVADICNRNGCFISNYNSPKIIIISGEKSKLKAAVEEAGGSSLVLNAISIPFHSPLLEDAQRVFAASIDRYRIGNPEFPIISNHTLEELTRGHELKKDLIAQVTSQVRWYELMQKIVKMGVTNFIAFGPAASLRSWMRDIDRTANVYVVDSPASLERTIHQLNNALATRVA